MTDLLHWQLRQLGTLILPTVNARELYDVLGITRPGFPAWIKLKVKEARLQESADFVTSIRKFTTALGGRPMPEYYLSCVAAARIAHLSGADNAEEVTGWCLAQVPKVEEHANAVPDPAHDIPHSELSRNTTRSPRMENGERNPISSFVPPVERSSDPVDGWALIKWKEGGRIQLCRVKDVEVFGVHGMSIAQPGREKYPRYKSSTSWADIEMLSPEEAQELFDAGVEGPPSLLEAFRKEMQRDIRV